MSKTHVPIRLRRQVARDGKNRCGFCLSQRRIIGRPMSVEHIIPEAKGGETVRGNLWLSCRRCNEFKGYRTQAADPLTGNKVPLFNPRLQSWSNHFIWSENGVEIIGLTAVGIATIVALRLNNEDIVEARALWVGAGWHPPR